MNPIERTCRGASAIYSETAVCTSKNYTLLATNMKREDLLFVQKTGSFRVPWFPSMIVGGRVYVTLQRSLEKSEHHARIKHNPTVYLANHSSLESRLCKDNSAFKHSSSGGDPREAP